MLERTAYPRLDTYRRAVLLSQTSRTRYPFFDFQREVPVEYHDIG
jgi:hypothetical protein